MHCGTECLIPGQWIAERNVYNLTTWSHSDGHEVIDVTQDDREMGQWCKSKSGASLREATSCNYQTDGLRPGYVEWCKAWHKATAWRENHSKTWGMATTRETVHGRNYWNRWSTRCNEKRGTRLCTRKLQKVILGSGSGSRSYVHACNLFVITYYSWGEEDSPEPPVVSLFAAELVPPRSLLCTPDSAAPEAHSLCTTTASHSPRYISLNLSQHLRIRYSRACLLLESFPAYLVLR